MIGILRKNWGARHRELWLLAAAYGWLLCGSAVLAQDNVPSQGPGAPQSEPAIPDDPITTMFHHAEWDRLWLSGQANFISQYHPTFTSPYQGMNSLSPEAQDATSRVLTLFTGWRASDTTEFLCDVQESGGHGLGEALGVAGFFNLDVVRNPTLSKAPYIARLMWHQIIPLSHRKVAVDRNPFNLFRELPERRLELRFGKFSLVLLR
jgi:high affinity Mn2+ porin